MSKEPNFRDTRGDLRRRSVRAGGTAMAGQAGVILLLVAATMVLARLLTPRDFGLVAMVMAVVSFTAMLRDLGLSTATVQRPEIAHHQVSTLFWVNAGVGALLTLTIAAAAPLIARFYGEPRLTGIALALASISVIDGLSIQHQAVLARELRYGALAAADLLATSAGIAAAVALAWLGAGYWALVALHVTMVAAKTTLVWLAGGWWPRRAVDLRAARSMLAYGGLLTGSRILIYLTRSVDRILIGKLWGAQPLGLYDRAYNSALMPFEQASWALSKVGIATLSRLQAEPARFRAYYRGALQLVATGALPLIAFLIVDAEPAVRIVLGDQWLATVPLLRLLAPVAAVHLLGASTRWVFLSLGRPGRLLRWRLLESSVRILAMAIGAVWGVAGVAAGLLISSWVLAGPALAYCFRGSPLRVRDVAAVTSRPLAAAVAAAAALPAVRPFYPAATGLVSGFLVDAVVLGAIYLGVWTLLPGGRAALKELGGLAAVLRPSG